jgi:hypothetical protein
MFRPASDSRTLHAISEYPRLAYPPLGFARRVSVNPLAGGAKPARTRRPTRWRTATVVVVAFSATTAAISAWVGDVASLQAAAIGFARLSAVGLGLVGLWVAVRRAGLTLESDFQPIAEPILQSRDSAFRRVLTAVHNAPTAALTLLRILLIIAIRLFVIGGVAGLLVIGWRAL